MNKIDEVLKLKELLDSGLINQSDFDRKKKEIFEETNNESKITNEIISSEVHQNIQERNNNSFDKRKCPQCGSENHADNNVCIVCKTDLTIFRQPTEPNQEPDIENRQSKYFIPIVLIGLLIIFGSFYIFRNYESSNNEDSEETIDEVLINDAKVVTPEATPQNSRGSNVDSTYINNESISSFLGNWTDGINTDISIGDDKSFSMGNSVCSSGFTYKEAGSELILVFENVMCKIQTQNGNSSGQEVGKCYIKNGELIIEFKAIPELDGTGIGGGNYKKGSMYD
jgi:hypothetical protein